MFGAAFCILFRFYCIFLVLHDVGYNNPYIVLLSYVAGGVFGAVD